MRLCACGCGAATPLLSRGDKRFGHIKGQPANYIRHHHSNRPRTNGSYQAKKHRGKQMDLHRVRAELVLGRPLKPTECVHHVDGTKSAASPLVICQDKGYHQQLHARQRLVSLGADPFKQYVCARCTKVKDLSEFPIDPQRWTGRSVTCKACGRELYAQRQRDRVA